MLLTQSADPSPTDTPFYHEIDCIAQNIKQQGCVANRAAHPLLHLDGVSSILAKTWRLLFLHSGNALQFHAEFFLMATLLAVMIEL